MPILNEIYPVYKTVKPVITKDDVKEIAGLFNLDGEISVLTPGVIQLVDTSKEPNENIEIFENSGGFRYIISDKMFRSVDYQPDLPSFDEAKDIADKFLSSKGLLPENADFNNVSVCYSQNEWIAGRSDPVKTYNILLCAQYMQIIDDLPTIGGTTTVYIGEKGEIVGVTKKIRALEEKPIRYSKIISPQQAFEELTEGKYVIKPLEENYDKITITNISIAYWIEPLASSQEYVYPVYVFSGTAQDNGETYPIVRYIWADPSAQR